MTVFLDHRQQCDPVGAACSDIPPTPLLVPPRKRALQNCASFVQICSQNVKQIQPFFLYLFFCFVFCPHHHILQAAPQKSRDVNFNQDLLMSMLTYCRFDLFILTSNLWTSPPLICVSSRLLHLYFVLFSSPLCPSGSHNPILPSNARIWAKGSPNDDLSV